MVLVTIWELEASRYDKNDVRRCANILHYRPTHSENFIFLIIFAPHPPQVGQDPSGPGPKWARAQEGQGPRGPRPKCARAQVGPEPKWARAEEGQGPSVPGHKEAKAWTQATTLGRAASGKIAKQVVSDSSMPELESSELRVVISAF